MNDNRNVWFVLPLRCLLFIAAFTFCSIMTQRNVTEIAHWWSILAAVINVVTIVLLWLICKRRKITYRELIHFEKKQNNMCKGLLLIVVMLLVGIGGMYLAGWLCYREFPYFAPMMVAPIPPYLAVINIFVLPWTTTLAEDGLYLGYGVNRFSSQWAAVCIPACFYALQHSFIPVIWDMQFMIYRFLSFFPLTLWICFRYRRGSSITYIMAGHAMLNIATTVQIVITSLNPEFYQMLLEQ